MVLINHSPEFEGNSSLPIPTIPRCTSITKHSILIIQSVLINEVS